jgi:hypothetical protein
MSDKKKIDTGGGAYVGGSVNTSGGKFVGRDDFSTTGASANELAQAFEKIYAAIEARPNTSARDKADLKAELKEAQTEAAKGEQASEDFLSRRLRNIQRMAPDILDVMTSTLASPALGAAAIIRKVAAKAKEQAGA